MILPISINAPSQQRRRRSALHRGWTLVEVMVAMSVGMLVLAAVGSTTVFCLRSFAGIYNYSDLDASSRRALDLMSRQIREATCVHAFQQSASSSYIELWNTNESPAVTNIYAWDASDQTMTWSNSTQEPITLLTRCTNWSCTLLQGWPKTNSAGYTFPYVADSPPTNCKIVDVRWSCCRTVFGIKVNSETEQGAQVALRNCQPL